MNVIDRYKHLYTRKLYYKDIKIGDYVKILSAHGFRNLEKNKIYKVSDINNCVEDCGKICTDCITDGYFIKIYNENHGKVGLCKTIIRSVAGEKYHELSR